MWEVSEWDDLDLNSSRTEVPVLFRMIYRYLCLMVRTKGHNTCHLFSNLLPIRTGSQQDSIGNQIGSAHCAWALKFSGVLGQVLEAHTNDMLYFISTVSYTGYNFRVNCSLQKYSNTREHFGEHISPATPLIDIADSSDWQEPLCQATLIGTINMELSREFMQFGFSWYGFSSIFTKRLNQSWW